MSFPLKCSFSFFLEDQIQLPGLVGLTTALKSHLGRINKENSALKNHALIKQSMCLCLLPKQRLRLHKVVQLTFIALADQ